MAIHCSYQLKALDEAQCDPPHIARRGRVLKMILRHLHLTASEPMSAVPRPTGPSP